MKKNFKYLMLALVAVMGFSLTSCKDDDVTLSRKVLASVDVLEYEGLAPDVQIITVVSDGEWVVEAPEWISVTPASGVAGQTEVEIALKDNLRDGSLDNPRRANVIFRGRSLDANATVLVRQDGDKWRDPVDFTIDDLEAAEEETVVKLPNMVVTAVTGNGFILSDGTKFAYITEATTPVSIGDKVSVMGEKFTDTMKMAYVKEYSTTIEGTAAVPSLTPFDISSTLDSTNGTTYQYVTLTGNYDGSSITVGDIKTKAYLIDPNPALGVNTLAGHKVQVTGYFAGLAAPVLNIIPSEIVDLGVNEIVYFSEDFEWISPWAIAGKNGDGSIPSGETIGTNGKSSEAPKADACTYNGITLTEELMNRGYDFVSAHDYNNDKGARDFALYVQQNYLKFNKTGNVNNKPYQEGLILPALKETPESGVPLTISFDWCPQMQGDGMYDKTEMAVIIENGGEEVEIVAPGHTRENNSAYSWQRATLDLSKVKIDTNTKITIRNSNAAFADKTAHRFYLDNIKISYIP